MTIPIALVAMPLLPPTITPSMHGTSIAKGMGARTSMSENELDILTRYFQYNAKDITEKQ